MQVAAVHAQPSGGFGPAAVATQDGVLDQLLAIGSTASASGPGSAAGGTKWATGLCAADRSRVATAELSMPGDRHRPGHLVAAVLRQHAAPRSMVCSSSRTLPGQ